MTSTVASLFDLRTGQHEIELRAYLGVWVYLTAQILLVLLVYHTLSVVAATTGSYEAQAHAAAPACLGLGIVVYGLFFFFYFRAIFSDSRHLQLARYTVDSFLIVPKKEK